MRRRDVRRRVTGGALGPCRWFGSHRLRLARRVTPEPLIDFSSGYVQRSIDKFPKQGSRAPWRLYQNYALDTLSLRFAPVEDGTLEFAS